MLTDIKQIKPKNIKQDDKYSKNLYKYLKFNRYYKDYPSSVHVYFNRNIGGFEKPEYKELDWDNLKIGEIYIGSNIMEDIWDNKYSKTGKIDFGQVICKNLVTILRGNKLKEQGCYCGFGHSYIKRDWIEITEEFWDRYIDKGLCLFDRHAYEEIDNKTRVCKYCGDKQNKVIKTYTCEYEEWE